MATAPFTEMGHVPAPVSTDPYEPVTVRVRGGRLVGAGSWLYVWVRLEPRSVVYAGGTPLPPAVRTWLHLNDEDPAVGRMAARRPNIDEEDYDVLAFALPPSVERKEARTALVTALADAGLLADDHVCDRDQEVEGDRLERSLGHHPDLLSAVSTVLAAVSGAFIG